MSELIRWRDIGFYVTPTSIRGVKDISIEAGSETEDSTTGGEKFVKRKNGNPYSIGMTAILDARLGETVQKTALQLTEAARCSKCGYFYMAGSKLFPSQFMMVTAKISNLVMNGRGVWISCEVALTLKQSTKYDGSAKGSTSSSAGSSSGSGASGNGVSSKKVSTKTQSATASNITLGYGPITDSYAARLSDADKAAKEAAKPKVTDGRTAVGVQDYSTKASANFQAVVNAALNKAKTQSQNIVVKAATAAKTTTKKVSTVSGVRKKTTNLLK